MNDICPLCLSPLPDDYPYDHVAIDRALAGDLTALARMDRAERRELVRLAYAAGIEEAALAARLHRSAAEIQRWLTEDHQLLAHRLAALDQQVRELWAEGLHDRLVAERLGVSKHTVFLSRRRQHLTAVWAHGHPKKELVTT